MLSESDILQIGNLFTFFISKTLLEFWYFMTNANALNFNLTL